MRKLYEEIKKSLLPLSFTLIILPLGGLYKILNGRTAGAYNVETWIDAKIPFSKVFIIPYVSWYAYIILLFAYMCLKNRKIYFKTLLSYNIGEMACFVIYFFFQTTVTRPALTGSDILTRMIGVIYGADEPYNCLPSIHVLSTLIIMIGLHHCREVSRKVILGADVLGVVIILSTLFVKQHAFLDVVAGAALTAAVVWPVFTCVDADSLYLWPIKRLSGVFPRVKRLVEGIAGNELTEIKGNENTGLEIKEEDLVG